MTANPTERIQAAHELRLRMRTLGLERRRLREEAADVRGQVVEAVMALGDLPIPKTEAADLLQMSRPGLYHLVRSCGLAE